MKNILIFVGIIIVISILYFSFKLSLPTLLDFKMLPNNQTIPSENEQNSNSNKDINKVPQVWSVDGNTTTNSSPLNKNLKTYKADGFSFQYDSKASVRVDNGDQSLGATYSSPIYFVREVGNNPDYTMKQEMIFLNHKKIDPENYCVDNIKSQTMIMGGKLFTYCDYPKAEFEPYARRIYFDDTPKGLITIDVTIDGPTPYTYIIPTSVTIN